MTVNGVTLDTRWIAYVIWGIGTLVVYSIVAIKRYRANKLHHDKRSRRELEKAVALWVVAFGAFLAITLILFGEAGTGVRGVVVAVCLGAFFSAGVIMAGEESDTRDEPVSVRR